MKRRDYLKSSLSVSVLLYPIDFEEEESIQKHDLDECELTALHRIRNHGVSHVEYLVDEVGVDEVRIRLLNRIGLVDLRPITGVVVPTPWVIGWQMNCTSCGESLYESYDEDSGFRVLKDGVGRVERYGEEFRLCPSCEEGMEMEYIPENQSVEESVYQIIDRNGGNIPESYRGAGFEIFEKVKEEQWENEN